MKCNLVNIENDTETIEWEKMWFCISFQLHVLMVVCNVQTQYNSHLLISSKGMCQLGNRENLVIKICSAALSAIRLILD